ncbi:ABC transporter ATP-binding protein [Desulfatiglans anilini]|uniref:ABC transporter ATP-binding protein n=1 Tax=Desulfatiglans anilini TaxID=90728 RepID=UPI000428164F|nr:ABC transporter ATP-binding protein [Desulfatiglans anilini]
MNKDKQPVIDVRGLTKTYRLYNSPLDRVKEVFHPRRKRYHRPFDALRDVSFTVYAGETVGIVGRNGSGKSTLLQLICGILEPSSGVVSVSGRVSALLELGAGFNPDFTGRQNVYLNGAILGLRSDEMTRRLDDIAAFADIGDFLDQPVRTYSSGMFIRLAFSVAINVDPQILIVDEALSVGDEIFQRKCHARLQEFRKAGKTIVFVSHSAQTVVEICNRALLLDQGELILEGTPKHVVSKYHKLIFAPPDRVEAVRNEIRIGAEGVFSKAVPPERTGGAAAGDSDGMKAFYDPNLIPKSTLYYESRGAEIADVHITTLDGERVNVLAPRQEYVYTYRVTFHADAFNVRFGSMIKTVSGLELGGAASSTLFDACPCVEAGKVVLVKMRFRCLLHPGVYFMNAGVTAVLGGDEVFLHRIVDVEMIRVQQEEGMLTTGIVDFCIEPDLCFETAKG